MCAMTATVTVETANNGLEPEPWRNSRAKKLLVKDIVDGKISGMTAEQVHKTRPEYSAYVYSKFRGYFSYLVGKHGDLLSLANEDGAALAHDLALGLRVNSKPYPRWDGSEAEALLKNDLDNGKHLHMKPRDLQLSRPQYSEFPGKVFRDHIQQELRARKERPYWLARRKEKEEAKRQKEEEAHLRKLKALQRKIEKEAEKQCKQEDKLRKKAEKERRKLEQQSKKAENECKKLEK